MTSLHLDSLTAQGVAAAKVGRRTEAQRFLEAALARDEKNVMAWWWLAQVRDEPQVRRKCLEKARSIAAASDQGRTIYQSLLRESGASTLPLYKLAKDSKSLGDMCPICTLTLEVSDIVVICPDCSRAHHLDCWEDNVHHCGNFACDGIGLVNRDSSVRIESAAAESAVVVGEEEIPTETPWKSQEEQEAGFVNRLRQQAVRVMAANVVRQVMMEEMAREAQTRALRAREARVREEAQQRQMELMMQTASAFLAGLIPGAMLAVATFRYSQSWAIALFTVYLIATSISTAAAHAIMASDRMTSVIYWLLPKAVAAAIMLVSFKRWENGLLAVILAYVGGVILADRILHARSVYERRAFIAYSVLALTGLIIMRSILI